MVSSLWNSQVSGLDTKEAADGVTRMRKHQVCHWTRPDGNLSEKVGLAHAEAQR